MFRNWYRRFLSRRAAARPAGAARPRCRPGLEALETRLVPDAGRLGFLAADFHVAEEAGNAVLSVVRDGGSDGTVSVDFTTRDETARAGVNFTATTGTLTFAPGDTVKTISVPVRADLQLVGSRAFGLDLTNPTGGATLQAPSSVADVTILYPNGTPDQRFVNSVYLTVLHRPVDPDGLASFTTVLSQGIAPDQIALAVQNSDEGRTVLVQDLYVTLLGREADGSGLLTFGNALKGGATVEQVKAVLLGSDEFFQNPGLGHGDNPTWLASVYQDVLHRPLDGFGEATFLQALANGVRRDQVAQLILTSPEGFATLVQTSYLEFLGRASDQPGFDFWVNFLQHGARDEALLAGFLGSPEYLATV
jgi:hypothetical protein